MEKNYNKLKWCSYGRHSVPHLFHAQTSTRNSCCIQCYNKKPIQAKGRPPKDKPKITETSWEHYKRNKPIQVDKKRKPINKQSNKFKDRMRAYMPIRDKYLNEHPKCEAFLYGCGIMANQIHHGAGKTGDLLFDVKYFKAVCDSCHHWIEINPLEAKKLGLSFDRLDK